MGNPMLEAIRKRFGVESPEPVVLPDSADLNLRAAVSDAIRLSDESRLSSVTTSLLKQPTIAVVETKMKAGVILFVVSDVRDFLVSQNLLSSDGSFGDFSMDQWLALAGVVEKSLQAHGVPVPNEIDAALSAFPLLAALITKLRK